MSASQLEVYRDGDENNGEELPFKYLVWLCYGLELERDLVLMDED